MMRKPEREEWASPQPNQAGLEGIACDQRVRPRLHRRLLLGVALSFAAAALILTLLHLHYANLSASPTDLLVFGENRLLAGSPGSLRVRLRNHTTGASLADVPVTIELRGKTS